MNRTIPTLVLVLAVAPAVVYAGDEDEKKKQDFHPGNATISDSVANERTPRMQEPAGAGHTPGPGDGAEGMDDDDSLSADSPIKGRAPATTAPHEAPGR